LFQCFPALELFWIDDQRRTVGEEYDLTRGRDGGRGGGSRGWWWGRRIRRKTSSSGGHGEGNDDGGGGTVALIGIGRRLESGCGGVANDVENGQPRISSEVCLEFNLNTGAIRVGEG